MKKLLAMGLILALALSLFVGCQGGDESKKESESPDAAGVSEEVTEATSGEFTLADEIEPPAGKTLLSLPVDQVAEEPLKIASVMVQNNPFGAAVTRGSEFAKSILADRNCTVDSIAVEDFDAQKWVSTIEDLISADYDAICMFGVSEALESTVNKAVDAGILVYIFNTEPGTNSNRQAYYGMDDANAGTQCGEALEEAMGGEGEYIIITGSFSVLGHESRRTGAREVLDANGSITLVGEYENDDKAEEAYTLVTNAITAYPNLKGVYVTAGGPSGAAKAIEDAGLTNQISLVCHDVLEETAGYIESGTITACLDQDPFNQGYQPVVDAFNKLVADMTPDEINFYDGIMATPANVKELFPEFF